MLPAIITRLPDRGRRTMQEGFGTMKREDIERHNALYAGGTQKIYISDNWTVSAPMDEVLQTIDYLRQMSEQDRHRCVASVRRSMDEAHPKMITHIATQSE